MPARRRSCPVFPLPEARFTDVPGEGLTLPPGRLLQIRVEDADLPRNGHYSHFKLQDPAQADRHATLLVQILPGAGEATVKFTPLRGTHELAKPAPGVLSGQEEPSLFGFLGFCALVQPVATEGAPAESPPLRPRIQPMQALDPIPETGALKAPKLNSLTGAPARTGRRAAPAGSCAIL